MLLNFDVMYRKYGVRVVFQLPAPHVFDTALLALPQDAIYHYLNYDGSTDGPGNDEYLLRNIKHRVPVMHVDDLTSFEGSPRYHAQQLNNIIKHYHKTHRHTWWLRDIAMGLRDRNTPIVINYSLVGKLYRYQPTVFSTYNRWLNIFATMLDQVVKHAEYVDRQHFIVLEAPKHLPSMAQLNASADGMSQTLAKVIKEPSAFVLMELWKWVYANRDASVFARIPPKYLHRFNFIYRESGKWFVLNLGRLNAWRQPQEGEEDDYEACVYQVKQKADPLQVAKRLLRMYVALTELRSVGTRVEEPTDGELSTADSNEEAEQQNEASDADDGDSEDGAESSTPSTDVQTLQKENKELEASLNEVNSMLASLRVLDDTDTLEYDQFRAHLVDEDAAIDDELKALEVIAQNTVAELSKPVSKVNEVLAEDPQAKPEDSVKALTERLANDGAISAAEYARFNKLAESYKTIVSPDGETTLDQYCKIHPETLKLATNKKAFVDHAGVLDKSMLQTTLDEFDSKYITKVLNKDVANSVMAVQNAGVAVTNYNVKQHEDILGAFEIHTLKLAPVVGAPSTLRFKLPKLDENGVFTSNGVKYRLRKQRVDVPIRKTGPNRVALTSYYGKCFITRARNNSASYAHWLQTRVMAKAIDATDKTITEPIVGDVFEQTLHAPRAYTALSKSFKGFKVGEWDFNFDHAEVAATWPLNIVIATEKAGSVLVARNAGQYLAMDAWGDLHVVDNEGAKQSIGDIESMLGLEKADAPVEYISVGIYGKDIPMGIVLGINMGFQRLVATLGAEHRIVPAGQRAKVQPDEYALAFTDETWVFKKKDRLATLILSGFNEYWKSLKQYSVYSFDQRGAYQNLLDSHDIGVRYMREIDLMYQMFVDPITRDLLIEMKEPKTFKGLLFRAAQLLLDDRHPDELDPAYMRIRGYERFSGAVYAELVQSIRMHNGKLARSNARLEMSPYAIFNRIAEDSAKSQSQEINPIKQLKEIEAVTFAGTGGRNKRSMTKNTRSFHENDKGTVSESTVDSGDVGINVFLTSNPQFTSLRGMSKPFDAKKAGTSALLSPSAMLAASTLKDDPKRVNEIAPSVGNNC